jgi:membrane-bound lytic murein transglycosylase D
MDVPVAAMLAEMPLDDFRALNPQFGRYVITGGSQTILLLPRENVDTFKANLQEWKRANKPLSSWTTYTVTKPREKVEAVATQFNTTAEILREVNHIPQKMLVKQGSTLLVPKTETALHQDIAPELVENATIATVYDGPPSKRLKIRVRRGDSLYSIAHRYRVTIAQIKFWNNLKSNRLRAGARLVIHAPTRAGRHKQRKHKVTQRRHLKHIVAERQNARQSNLGGAG